MELGIHGIHGVKDNKGVNARERIIVHHSGQVKWKTLWTKDLYEGNNSLLPSRQTSTDHPED